MRQKLPFVAIVLLVLFAALGAVVYFVPSIVEPVDALFHSLVAPLQTVPGVLVAEDITFFGSTLCITLGVILVVVIFRRRSDIIFRLLIAIIGASLSAEYLKSLVHRVRPSLLHNLVAAQSYSFPSGHANSSIVLYGYLALLLYLQVRTKVWRNRSVAVCLAAIVLIGLSRIVLQYHYASDVLGGYLLGAFWVAFSLSIPLRNRSYRLGPSNESRQRSRV